MKPFFHPPLSPWKSLRRFPHSHRHDDYDEDDYFSSKPGRLRDTRSEGKIRMGAGKPILKQTIPTLIS